MSESSESLTIASLSESIVKGQLPLKEQSGVCITVPFVFGTCHPGLIHKKVDSILELPLFVAYVSEANWLRIGK